MNAKELHEISAKLDKLFEREDIAEIHVFTSEEVAEIQRLLVFVRRVDALGWWGKWLFWVFVSVGAIAANWERIVWLFTGGTR